MAATFSMISSTGERFEAEETIGWAVGKRG
jgi:hypothetical protein